LIINAGIGFWLGLELDWLLLSLLTISFYDVLAHTEDKFLETRFGEAWKQWKSDVPYAFLPSRRSKMPEIKPTRSWWQSVWSDRWTWFWMILVLSAMTWYRSMYAT
jgi:hypothetical protein